MNSLGNNNISSTQTAGQAAAITQALSANEIEDKVVDVFFKTLNRTNLLENSIIHKVVLSSEYKLGGYKVSSLAPAFVAVSLAYITYKILTRSPIDQMLFRTLWFTLILPWVAYNCFVLLKLSQNVGQMTYTVSVDRLSEISDKNNTLALRMKSLEESHKLKDKNLKVGIFIDCQNCKKLDDVLKKISCFVFSTATLDFEQNILNLTALAERLFTGGEQKKVLLCAKIQVQGVERELEEIKNLAKGMLVRDFARIKKELETQHQIDLVHNDGKDEIETAQISPYIETSSLPEVHHIEQRTEPRRKTRKPAQKTTQQTAPIIVTVPAPRTWQTHSIIQFQSPKKKQDLEKWISGLSIPAQKLIESELLEFPNGTHVKKYNVQGICGIKIPVNGGPRIYITMNASGQYVCIRWGNKNTQVADLDYCNNIKI